MSGHFHPKTITALLYALLFIAVSTVLVIAMLGFWWFWPYSILDVHEVKALTPVVQPGGEAIIWLHYDKPTGMKTTVFRYIRNAVKYEYTDRTPALPVGKDMKETTSRVVPPNFHHGWYWVGAEYEYFPNPIRHWRGDLRGMWECKIWVGDDPMKGEKGETGATGKTGPRGLPGKDAPTAPPAEKWPYSPQNR